MRSAACAHRVQPRPKHFLELIDEQEQVSQSPATRHDVIMDRVLSVFPTGVQHLLPACSSCIGEALARRSRSNDHLHQIDIDTSGNRAGRPFRRIRSSGRNT